VQALAALAPQEWGVLGSTGALFHPKLIGLPPGPSPYKWVPALLGGMLLLLQYIIFFAIKPCPRDPFRLAWLYFSSPGTKVCSCPRSRRREQ